MADSLFGSLLRMIDARDVRAISTALGEPEHSVSRCIQNSIAAVMGNLCSKAEDPGALRKSLDLLPGSFRDSSWSNLVESATDPSTPAIGTGEGIVSGLFGRSERDVINAIGKHNGMNSGVVSRLMAVCAPFVLSFIGTRVRENGLSMSSLGNILQRESAAIRNALPAGVTEFLWPRAATMAAGASPVIAQEVHRERRTNWAAPLALAALALGLGWWFAHRRPVAVEESRSAATGTASRAMEERATPSRVPESKPVRTPEPMKEPAGVHAVMVQYPTGSMKMTPQSQVRLNRLVARAAANPDLHLKVAGFTDDVGSAEGNLKLSQQRADGVRAMLIHKGVAPTRVSAKGYGEADPIATNETSPGRAANRRVTISLE